MCLQSETYLPPCWALLQIQGKCIKVLSGRNLKSYFRMPHTHADSQTTQRNTHIGTRRGPNTQARTERHTNADTHTKHTQACTEIPGGTHRSSFLYNNLFLMPQPVNQQWKHLRGPEATGGEVGTPKRDEGSVFSGIHSLPEHLPVGRV